MSTTLKYSRREAHEVTFGGVKIGSTHPIAVQSMTNTPTADVTLSVEQTKRIAAAGAEIVRLTAQGKKEGEALGPIMEQLRKEGCTAAIVADIHFTPEIAMMAAEVVDKVRINPGNFRTSNGELERLIDICRRRGVALRIGVNHGSLAKRIFDEYGDTPEGMVASAMEFLRMCREAKFDNVVVSMKSSNTRVMVHAYRLLVEAMAREDMTYPLHLGVTEAGDGIEGRIKSAVGIGALLADGIGDTLRVSLTEDPENEVPVGRIIVEHFAKRSGEFEVASLENYSPTTFKPRTTAKPIVHSEITEDYDIVDAISTNPTHEWRAAILNRTDNRPVVLRRRYEESDPERVAIYAAADMGQLLIDGLADGVWIEDCVQLSKHIEANLDREVEDYELEVGSAGIGQPFKVLQQYVNHIGKEVEVLACDGKKYRGVLGRADEEAFAVVVKVKEKPEGAKRPVLVDKEYAWKYNEIKYTKYLINF